MFSLITLSEVDCRNLSIRDIGYFTYKKKWEKETISIMVNQKKNWKITKKGTSVYFLNNILCDRVLR